MTTTYQSHSGDNVTQMAERLARGHSKYRTEQAGQHDTQGRGPPAAPDACVSSERCLLRPSTWHRGCVLNGCADAALTTKKAGAWRGGQTPLALPPTSSLCSTPATSTLAVYFFLCSLTTQELSVALPYCCSLFIERKIALLFSLQC